MQLSREYRKSQMNYLQRKKKTREKTWKQMRKSLCLMEQKILSQRMCHRLKRSRENRSLRQRLKLPWRKNHRSKNLLRCRR